MSNFDDFFPKSGAGNVGVFPVLTPLAGAATANISHQANRVEGFVGDGDYLELPVTAGGNLQYFNSSDVSQWTRTVGAIGSATNEWVGFFFDNSLVYTVAVNTSTTPDTFHLASISVGNTLTQIGGAAPGVDFDTPAAGYWANGAAAVHSSNIQRDAVGSGNVFVLRSGSGATAETMEMNFATGAIASDPADIDAQNIFQAVPWRIAGTTTKYVGTTSGSEFTSFDSAQGAFMWPSLAGATVDLIGLPETQFKFLQWKATVTGVDSTSTTNAGTPRFWNLTVFNQWVEDMMKLGGIP